MAGVIFDPAAKSHFLHHLEIELGAHLDPLRFQKFVLAFKPGNTFVQLNANGLDRAAHFFVWGDELFRWKQGESVRSGDGRAGKRIESSDLVDFVSEEFDSNCFLVRGRRIYFYHIASGPKFSTRQSAIVSLVKHVDHPRQHKPTRTLLSTT